MGAACTVACASAGVPLHPGARHTRAANNGQEIGDPRITSRHSIFGRCPKVSGGCLSFASGEDRQAAMVGRGLSRSSLVVASLGVASACALCACDSDKPRGTSSEGTVSLPLPAHEGAAPEPALRSARPRAEASASPSSRPADAKACSVLCKIGDELECGTPFPICVQQCQEMTNVPKCSAEMQAALQCFARQPTPAWECDAEAKMPTVKDGVCGEEQRRVAECIQT